MHEGFGQLLRGDLLHLNPIEEAFSKIKGHLGKAESRTRGALVEAMGRAISAVTLRDAEGYFEHRGYRVAVQQP